MLRKTSLVVGSIVLASPMLLSIVRKNNSHVDIKLTPKYYEQSEESLFILENQKE